MKVEIRNVKYAAFASEETSCFSATVVLDGKVAGTVSNDGRGGCHRYSDHSTYDRLEAHARTLPPLQSRYGPLAMSADLIVGKLLDDWLLRKDLKRITKGKVAFVKADGKLYTAKVRGDVRCAAEEIAKKSDVRCVLNLMPEDEAVGLLRRCSE